MLVLFDIDGTLIRGNGDGMASLVAAGRELFHADFHADGVSFAGRLDPVIVADLFARNGVDAATDAIERLRGAYAAKLAERFETGERPRPLPGVLALLDRLASIDGLCVGVLSGNYEETGLIKLQAGGIDPARFEVRVWGTDGPERSDLLPVALERHTEATGLTVGSHEVVVVGDTPHDVEAAAENGCRSLAVATGGYSVADLMPSYPDLLLETLEDTDEVVSWLTH